MPDPFAAGVCKADCQGQRDRAAVGEHPARRPLFSLQGIAPTGRFWLAVLIGALLCSSQQ